MDDRWKTVGLLFLSNTFMTAAWYGHLRFRNVPMLRVVLVSWGIALFEYLLMIPANRIGYRSMSAYQLKITQEVITLMVFVVFAAVWLGEGLRARYAVSMLLTLVAVVVAFRP